MPHKSLQNLPGSLASLSFLCLWKAASCPSPLYQRSTDKRTDWKRRARPLLSAATTTTGWPDASWAARTIVGQFRFSAGSKLATSASVIFPDGLQPSASWQRRRKRRDYPAEVLGLVLAAVGSAAAVADRREEKRERTPGRVTLELHCDTSRHNIVHCWRQKGRRAVRRCLTNGKADW